MNDICRKLESRSFRQEGMLTVAQQTNEWCLAL